MISLTKNLLKTSKYNKNFLILPKLLNLNTKNMNYPLQLKKKLAQTMAQVDHHCMGLDLLEAYEYHLASDSFELLHYWMEYFGVFDNPEENLLDQMLNPKTLQTK
jgi:hypothetical protein